MIYDNLKPIGREEFQQAMRAGGDPAARALVRMALFESDQQWAEEQCLAGLTVSDSQVRLAAVTSAGHLVRRHLSLRPAIIERLRELCADGLVGGMAQDALDDVRIFAQQQ